MLPENKLSSQ